MDGRDESAAHYVTHGADGEAVEESLGLGSVLLFSNDTASCRRQVPKCHVEVTLRMVVL
jgi:hypothetical protein